MKDYDSNFNSALYDKNVEKDKKRIRLKGDRKYFKKLKFLANKLSYVPSGAYLYTPCKDKTRKSLLSPQNPFYYRLSMQKSLSEQ